MDEQSQQHDRLAQLERQVQEHLDGWKRAKADYLNLKKQTDREKQEIVQFTRGTTVLEFLPIYDNLKRAMEHIPPDQRGLDWVKGLDHIRRQFEETLKAMEITPIAVDGQQFDPALHSAVSQQPQEGVAPGTIIKEVRTGWKLGDRVLEPAHVIVAQ